MASRFLNHRNRLAAFLEFAPLLAFSLSGRLGLEVVERFHLGAALAVACTALLLAQRRPLNPLLLGTNAWLCAESLAWASGVDGLVRASALLQESAFFAVLLVTGLVRVALWEAGLFAMHRGPGTRRGSLVLLALIAAGLGWSLAWRGDEQVAAVLPATLVFLVQQSWPLGRA